MSQSAAHPVEEHFAERFNFLNESEREFVLLCIKEKGPPNCANHVVRELALHIDSECEWQRIEKATPEQITAELRDAGIDCTKAFDRMCDMLARHGVKIKTPDEWREEHARQYRQLFGQA